MNSIPIMYLLTAMARQVHNARHTFWHSSRRLESHRSNDSLVHHHLLGTSYLVGDKQMIFMILLLATIALAGAIIIIDYKINNNDFPEVAKHQKFIKAMGKK